MNTHESPQQMLLEYLSQFVSGHKRELIETVLDQRTRRLTVVLEDVSKAHNASACLRTCEAFGVQDVHVIENRYSFDLSRDVALGAAQWLTLHRHRGGAEKTAECLQGLKSAGYRIVATTPYGDAKPLDALDLEHPTALLFGHEADGLSETALQMADERLRIPTVGFMDSLNLSVCVGIVVQQFAARLWASDVDWRLSEAERAELRLQWVRHVTRRWRDRLEKRFRREFDAPPAGEWAVAEALADAVPAGPHAFR